MVGIAFDDPAYVTWLAYNPEPETSRLRYGYSSMTTPDTLFELDMDTGERRVIKQQEVKGLDTSCYQSEHLWVTARDGVEVPVSLVYHRDHFRKGSNPLLVYGYGSYGESIDADFSASRLEACSTAALSTPSPMSAAGASWGSSGMRTANFCVRKIPSTTIWTSVTRCWPRVRRSAALLWHGGQRRRDADGRGR